MARPPRLFADRLKVHLREKGRARPDRRGVRAGGQDDLALIVKRVEALANSSRPTMGQPARRREARGQHPARRGEEGQDELRRRYDLDKLTEGGVALAAVIEASAGHHGAITWKFRRGDAGIGRAARAVDAFFDKVTVNAPNRPWRQPPRAAVGDRAATSPWRISPRSRVTSCPRRREPRTPGREEVTGAWIPAFAGITITRCRLRPESTG